MRYGQTGYERMNDYYDLGTYSRPITTTSLQAQTWFDRGLIWTYGFNHEEAIRCFERALEFDPHCAMAYWGLAYASGPYINKEWSFYTHEELEHCLPLIADAIEKGGKFAEGGTEAERAMIDALKSRYQSTTVQPIEEMNRWNFDFADAMSAVYSKFPEDRDIISIYAEAMMMKTPWRLWDTKTQKAAEGADTVKMLAVLENGLRLAKRGNLTPHPGLGHMMIHTVEMSPYPEWALEAADGLRTIAPDSGHLCHMPTHIDALCGHYYDALVASERSIEADKKYLAQFGPFGQYTAAVCHDNHLKMFVSMFLGRWDKAIEAADMICEILTDEVLLQSTPAFQITLEAYYSMRMHVFVRFGKWQEIIDEPMPENSDLYPVTTAMHHYAKGIAYATLKNFDAAGEERENFERTVSTISKDRHLFNNTSRSVLAIAREMMCGEIYYHKGYYVSAFSHLRQAVALSDGLFYTEPWAWMHPPRHALGALLLAQDHVEEAEAVYRADLGLDGTVNRANVHPDNIWSLHGFVECLEKLDKMEEVAIWRQKLNEALLFNDVPITSSCACRIVESCCAG